MKTLLTERMISTLNEVATNGTIDTYTKNYLRSEIICTKFVEEEFSEVEKIVLEYSKTLYKTSTSEDLCNALKGALNVLEYLSDTSDSKISVYSLNRDGELGYIINALYCMYEYNALTNFSKESKIVVNEKVLSDIFYESDVAEVKDLIETIFYEG